MQQSRKALSVFIQTYFCQSSLFSLIYFVSCSSKIQIRPFITLTVIKEDGLQGQLCPEESNIEDKHGKKVATKTV